jgi:hypothetical protein
MRPDRYAVLGNPVAHSRRPSSTPRFAAQTGAAGGLRPPAVPAGRLRGRVRGFAAGPGGRGCNVTVPFKFEALLVAGARGRASAPRWPAPPTCCASTAERLVGRQHRRHRPGARHRARRRGAGRPRVLLVGAGGAAAGVLGPLLEAGRPRWCWPTARRQGRGAGASARRAGRGAGRAAARAGWPNRRGLRRRRQRQRQQPAGAACRCRPPCCARRAGRRPDVRPGGRALPGLGRAPTAPCARRPGHAGGAGGRGLLRCGAACAATAPVLPRCAPRRRSRGMKRRPGHAPGCAAHRRCASRLLVLSHWRCSWCLPAAHRADGLVDPQSTSFQRSEAWRLLVEQQRLPGRSSGSPASASRPPEARRHRQRGRRLHRPRRRRLGRHREGLGAQPARRGPRRARPRSAAQAGRWCPRSWAAPPSRSSWPRTCSSRASARCCARRRNWCWRCCSKPAGQGAHPGDLPEQRRVGRGRVRRQAAARHYFRVDAAGWRRPRRRGWR